MNGYAGKILRLDLTHRKVITIATSDYEQWGGGHGMGSAIFFDLVKDKTIDGFDPANVVTLMTSPFCGTLVPAAGARTEVQGIGVQSHPIGWFTRSNFGGRFSTQLKHAGWDGVVIEGKADAPIWIDIRDGEVQIRNCSELSLWGKGTRECQEAIWDYVAGNDDYGDWIEPTGKDGGRTTQRPAILSIGPAGENLSRLACLIHDAGNGSGQGGFGGVWGSKNLKAVSVIGTGGVGIHDPKALMKARLWLKKNYAYDPENAMASYGLLTMPTPPYPDLRFSKGRPKVGARAQACVSCHAGCRGRFEDGRGNESTCIENIVYHGGKTLDIQRKTPELYNKYGVNAYELMNGVGYLAWIGGAGAFGPDSEIDCPLDFDDYGSYEFIEQLVKMIAYRNDGRGNPSQFGDDLSEGFARAGAKWGLEDGPAGPFRSALSSAFPIWGLPKHLDPRVLVEWGFGSILGDRDINEHCFSVVQGSRDVEKSVRIHTEKMVPFDDDMQMFDFSDENLYSEHIAKFVSWHRYYTRFYKQSLLYCDWKWPDFHNVRTSDGVGVSGQAEPKFYKAVTGKSMTFLEGIKMGKKIWNLDHAIWTLQGRHRDMVHFSDAMYTEPVTAHVSGINAENGKWERLKIEGRHIERDRFEEFKTRFYELQGWNTESGFPTRSTLANMGMNHVADELEAHGKLGA